MSYIIYIIKNIMKEKMKSVVTSLLLIIYIAIYPIIFIYCKNVEEIIFTEIVHLLMVFVIISIGIWLLCLFLFKKLYKSTLVAFILVGIIFNYMLIQQAFTFVGKNLKYWHVLPIILFVVFHAIYFIMKKTREDTIKDIVIILSTVMIGLFAINYLPAIPRIVGKMQSNNKVENKVQVDGGQDNPNVYWMIFDECASFTTIENYYGYSDKTIYNFLIDSGFEVSDTSKNEAANTIVVLTNCLNIDYIVNTSLSATQMGDYRIDPMLTRIMTEEGYTIRGIGNTEWLGIPSVNYSENNGGQTVEGFDIHYLILKNTIIGPFVEYDGIQSAKLVLETLEYMKQTSNFTPNDSQFNIMYLCSPHQPFLFDENGSDVQAVNYNNWEDDRYYLGQYKFIMKELKSIVENILDNDSDSVIIISSDHGPRFKDEIPYEDKLSILNAVYFMGEDISEIEGKSGVNTLRTVLNRLFDYDLEDVEIKDVE